MDYWFTLVVLLVIGVFWQLGRSGVSLKYRLMLLLLLPFMFFLSFIFLVVVFILLLLFLLCGRGRIYFRR